ncbi:MAG: O-antigen ligase family protein [bacterium]|nr:O-antigen ligase family protein [bacterium]
MAGKLAFNGIFFAAIFIGCLLSLTFNSGNWIHIVVVGIIPFLMYALIKNTMMVFLIWIGSTPILSNFVRVNLGAGIPDITINRIAIILLMMTLVFQAASKTRTIKRTTDLEWAMLGFGLIILPAIFNAYDPIQAGQQIFDHIITPFIVFTLSKNLISSREMMRPLIWTLGIVTLYCAVLGFQEHFTEYSFFTDSGRLNWTQEDMADRIQGPFDSPQVLGSVMVGGVVFFFYQMINSARNSVKFFSLLIVVVHTFVTYWTYRRSVWMGYVATMIFLAMVDKRFLKMFSVMTIVGIFLFISNWELISQSNVFQERVANARTVNDRWVIWITSIEIIKQFPVWGTGLGWFGTYFQKYFTFFGNTVTTDYAHGITSAHNSYIRMWVEGGPMLLISYLIILVLMTKRVFLLLIKKIEHPFVGTMEVMVFVGICLTQYLQSLTTDLIFHGQYSAILIFVIGGVLFQDKPKMKPVAASHPSVYKPPPENEDT